jgi:hypothetical protein
MLSQTEWPFVPTRISQSDICLLPAERNRDLSVEERLLTIPTPSYGAGSSIQWRSEKLLREQEIGLPADPSWWGDIQW